MPLIKTFCKLFLYCSGEKKKTLLYTKNIIKQMQYQSAKYSTAPLFRVISYVCWIIVIISLEQMK